MNLLSKHNDFFQLLSEELSSTAIEHRINSIDNHTKQYRFSPTHKVEINRQVGDMLEQNIIAESESPYNFSLWIVPKKADSKGNKR